MKILVSGATGFLGSHLVRELLQDGYEIAILKRSFSNVWRIADILKQVNCYDLDKCELEQPFKEHGKFDAVIHTATCYGRKGESIEQIFGANTLFPLKLLETAVSFNTDLFFNADTILDKYLNEYALSKKQFMEWGKQFAFMQKIRFVNIKLEHMYGAFDDESKFSTTILHKCLNNAAEIKLTIGEQKRDFIYIDDVIAAYQVLLKNVLLQKELFQDYELGTGRPISIKQFVQTVHQLTNSKTVLKFGAIPYRKNEIMQSSANTSKLHILGWYSKVDLITGLKYVLKKEQLK